MALRPSHAISPLCTDSHKTYGALGLGRLQTRRHELGSGPNLRCLSIRRQCLSGRTTFNFRWRKRSISGDSNLRIKQQPTQWILILRHLSLLLLGKIVLFFWYYSSYMYIMKTEIWYKFVSSKDYTLFCWTILEVPKTPSRWESRRTKRTKKEVKIFIKKIYRLTYIFSYKNAPGCL